MTKEELEKYLNKEVEITIGVKETTYKGKLTKKDTALTKVIRASYGLEYKDDWFTLIIENQKYYDLRPEVVKKIKEVEDVSM